MKPAGQKAERERRLEAAGHDLDIGFLAVVRRQAIEILPRHGRGLCEHERGAVVGQIVFLLMEIFECERRVGADAGRDGRREAPALVLHEGPVGEAVALSHQVDAERAVVADDPKQAKLAQAALQNADLVAVTTITLCEFVWVLSRGYGVAQTDIGAAIRALIASRNVEADRPAIEFGLRVLDAGGDFADGVIAFEGTALGAESFASFDRDAVKRLQTQGVSASLLA